MKRLASIFLALCAAVCAQAQQYGSNLVHVLYDRDSGRVYPLGVEDFVTNNPSILALQSGVSALESRTNAFSEASVSENGLEVSGRVSFPDGAVSKGSEIATAADLAPVVLSMELNNGACETNTHLVAQSFAAVYEMKGSVMDNAAGVSSNAASISDLREEVGELRELVRGATPAIETPDGKKWRAVGVYFEDGKPTHAWAEYTGEQYGTIVLDMPDNRHFKMVGVYVDTEQGRKTTHAWEEIIYE